ncbi:uncharacterized protein [Triticum aestivum]|nr:uncharacterized protein LOC123044951 isoform X2 [Triticum aestivum]XP_044323770.1 uncharacterized protein LOC123044951 isoform X2 [Triticum aestivum]XP_044323771.1 uncharacterized protein LOC123044951 isoform X2 [Triticum aestivum]
MKEKHPCLSAYTVADNIRERGRTRGGRRRTTSCVSAHQRGGAEPSAASILPETQDMMVPFWTKKKSSTTVLNQCLEEFYIISLVHLQHVKWIILFRAPVHAAPACAGSGEGSDHFGSIVRSLSLHFCKRLFPGLEPVTSWSQGSSFTTAPRLPFWLHSFDSRYIFSLGLFTKENDLG